MNIPITQSKSWQKLQNDLKETSFFEQETDYQYLAILKKTPVGNYLYLPYGPVFQDKIGFRHALASIQAIAKQNKAIFIRIEPQDPKAISYLPKNSVKTKDLNPKETWTLDLSGSDDELKQKLPSRLLRYHKSASKNNLTIETSNDPNDIHYLLSLQKALADKKGINTFSEQYLKTELEQPFATLYLVKYSDGNNTDGCPNLGNRQPNFSEDGGKCEGRTHHKVIATGLVFDDAKTRYNLQGAQSEQGRKLHATGILTIQLILDAKAKGLKTFDFWGIAPEGAPKSHPWAGFTAFKKTFTGVEVNYAGTYDLVLSPLKYRLYKIFRSINRLLH